MTNKQTLVIADADALVALANPTDVHHQKVREISSYLDSNNIAILFPVTAIFEAITTLQRKLTKPELSALLIEKVNTGALPVTYIEESIFTEARKLFNPYGSKQNTLYDALVATLAKHYDAKAVFSFDGWYEKLGLTLAEDLLSEQKKAA